MAEEEGFEPPDLLQSPVFKTGAFDHSAIPPHGGEGGILLKTHPYASANFKKYGFTVSRGF